MWGLQERMTAVDSLLELARQLRAARSYVQEVLPQADHAALNAFFSRAVEATGGSGERQCYEAGFADLWLRHLSTPTDQY